MIEPSSKSPAPLRVGEVLEVEVERLVPGGAGLAHARGHTLFVALAAPGDRVRVRVARVRGRTAFASIAELLAPGPARVEPPCPYFGRCGGCDFQQLAYDAQLAAKVEFIRDCLRRIARLTPPADIPITPSPAAWHYRARARWQHDPEHKRLGYYELASHRVCDVAECPVVVPEVQATLARLRELMNDDALPAAAAEFQAVAGDDGVALAPPINEADAGARRRTIAGEHYQFDADCFFQINHALLEPLVRAALQDTHDGDAQSVSTDLTSASAVDLYCGVGLFTLPLARRFARVTAVEANARACAYARRNLAAAQLTNARVETAQTGPWLTRHAARLAPVALVLLDPPRAGADAETLDGILALRPQRIAYVSCDPATLARDLRALTAHGYALASLAAFDLFPQTHHVETVAHLTRAAS
ncbi:MAG TPA: class I SAM-dependent RNA methyltransferase [Pyrinomonadaceae bacterium]|jgi:23S rRNA (uracil1939-C5)-methyltransferase